MERAETQSTQAERLKGIASERLFLCAQGRSDLKGDA